MNVSQLIAPTAFAPTTTPRKVKPSKIAKAPKAPKALSPLALEIMALREELSTLTGAPCSPLMGVESLTKAIAKAKLPQEVEVEEVEDEDLSTEPKARVIPAKAQGIGAHCVNLLKGGM